MKTDAEIIKELYYTLQVAASYVHGRGHSAQRAKARVDAVLEEAKKHLEVPQNPPSSGE